MQTRTTTLMLLAWLTIAAAPCAAKDQIVFVNDDNFDPKDVTISVGDTVTFKDFGDSNAHNVHASDDSFECSLGCRGDGSGKSFEPTKSAWTATLSFTKTGVVAYVCDQHAQMGMTGTINVVAAPAGQTIVPGITGNWSDPTPNQSGHGIQVEVLPNNGLLAIWFVFNPAGTAQAWIIALGGYDPTMDSATIPAFLETGGTFPPHFDHSKLTTTAWGTMTLTFTDCSNGMFDFAASDAAKAAGYGDASFPLSRVTNIAGVSCP